MIREKLIKQTLEKYHCSICRKIIVKDILKYFEDYPEENWMQCPYCGYHIKMEKIKKEVLKCKKELN